MTITDMLLTPGATHGRTGQPLTPQGIVVHYVANPGSTAANNRNWFENGAGGAHSSSHYIIGLNGEILRLIPDNERAMHAGKSFGKAWDEMVKTNNARFIGIECCHPDATGKFNEKTYAALVWLVRELCKAHGLDARQQVYRHYDVCGKMCPLYYVNNLDAWKQFLTEAAQPVTSTPSAWELEQAAATEWGKENGITDGRRPQDTCTRVEMWAMLMRFFKLICKMIGK